MAAFYLRVNGKQEHQPSSSLGFPGTWAVQHYLPKLLKLVEEGKIDPSFVITDRASLKDGPALYKKFRDKQDGCIKVVMKP
jgi:threonine dehydrogenase-like Zn-dependent dehydrogenase